MTLQQERLWLPKGIRRYLHILCWLLELTHVPLRVQALLLMMLDDPESHSSMGKRQQPAGPPVQLGSERQSPPDEWALSAPQNVAPTDQSLLLLLLQIEAALQGNRGALSGAVRDPCQASATDGGSLHSSQWYSLCLCQGCSGMPHRAAE